MKRRIFSAILAIMMIATIVPMAVFSVGAAEVSDLTYEITEGQVTITGCDKNATGELVIPSEIEGCPVTSIGAEAFLYCEDLTSITLSESVTSIGYGAFNGCISLESITIPYSLTSIGSYAFRGCSSLTSITIPESVTSIGSFAFRECTSLRDVYYLASEDQWNSISIADNESLLNAKIHYSKHPDTCKAFFYDNKGKLYEEQEVAYGETITAPSVPKADKKYGFLNWYRFVGWTDETGKFVKPDETVTMYKNHTYNAKYVGFFKYIAFKITGEI